MAADDPRRRSRRDTADAVVTDPDVTDADVSDPDVTDPDVSDHDVTNPDVADVERLDTEGGRMPQGGLSPAAPDQAVGEKQTGAAPHRAEDLGPPPAEGTTGVSSSVTE